jgi:hypothetical protein
MKMAIKYLTNPDFLRWLEQFGSPIKPDERDFYGAPRPKSMSEQARQYRAAQRSKVIRLYDQWLASLNGKRNPGKGK